MKVKINGKIQDVKLPVHFKQRWLKALRSGNYKQTTLHLLDDKGYCCLGVAGSICGIPNSILQNKYTLNFRLGKEQIKKVPLVLRDGTYDEIVSKLTAMNDNGKSFKYIASYIERYL